MIVEESVKIYNKNVDIKFSAHDAYPSLGTLKIERLESQII
jgi:hypothetical protein